MFEKFLSALNINYDIRWNQCRATYFSFFTLCITTLSLNFIVKLMRTISVWSEQNCTDLYRTLMFIQWHQLQLCASLSSVFVILVLVYLTLGLKVKEDDNLRRRTLKGNPSETADTVYQIENYKEFLPGGESGAMLEQLNSTSLDDQTQENVTMSELSNTRSTRINLLTAHRKQ